MRIFPRYVAVHAMFSCYFRENGNLDSAGARFLDHDNRRPKFETLYLRHLRTKKYAKIKLILI